MLATSTDQDLGSECGNRCMDESNSSSGITTRRVVTSDWTCNVGEPILAFAMARLSMLPSACIRRCLLVLLDLLDVKPSSNHCLYDQVMWLHLVNVLFSCFQLQELLNP